PSGPWSPAARSSPSRSASAPISNGGAGAGLPPAPPGAPAAPGTPPPPGPSTGPGISGAPATPPAPGAPPSPPGVSAGPGLPGASGATPAPGVPGGTGNGNGTGNGSGSSGGGTPWTDTSAESADDASVPLPDTVYTSPVSGRGGSASGGDGAGDGDSPDADAPTALMDGGSSLPPTAVRPTLKATVPGTAPGTGSGGAADLADAATGRGAGPAPRRTPRGGGPSTPPPPGPPPPAPGAPGTPAAGYLPTQLSPQVPGPPPPAAPPAAPAAPGGPGGVHQAATVLSDPGRLGPQGPGVPQPPGPLPGAVPPAYHSTGVPTVGPGYQAVLRYRAADGSEARLIRRSAPGTPHPEWQMLHELRALNVPPQQVLELHTELESCLLPGGYCARMIAETWPQARITSIAPYGTDHVSRQQGMRQLLTHQGELHQVADGPARPAPVRAPLPQVQQAPPVPPQAVAQELVSAFGPQAVCRFDQRAVSRQGVPETVAATLVWAGLPADFNPFFWAQPAHPVVPTLAELAAQRQVQAAVDAGSYLVVGNDFGRAICVQYGTAHIVAVPVEAAGPGGQPTAPQFVNSGLPEFVRCMALLGRMWRFRYGLNPEQAGRWTVDFQAQLAALDPAAPAAPDNWWSVLLEQMWDGLL
ncbi:SUKH-4 family immunity protein, partial [Streptomyces sp. NPDC001985]|uniref:SUKH-4 family immunity protein n=1 Tax=Streptomyces sp. NPDC001985 TaxID=3154406 RepID=UPI00331CB05D